MPSHSFIRIAVDVILGRHDQIICFAEQLTRPSYVLPSK